MVDANSLIEGHCKFRDGKKWKTRWAVVTKLSPVADCLQLQIYRDEKERARNGHTKASLSLQAFLALESGFTLDKESHTLAIICQDLCVVLALDNRERLIQWTVRISNNLGEGQQFLVQLAGVPPKSKLTPGPVKLHVTDRKLCLTGGIPPRLLGFWEVPHLRRYGIVDGRLVFEGGSRCGKGEGVHVLVPDPPQIGLIIDALDMSSKGQLITRAPSRRFGSSVTDSPRKSISRISDLQSSTTSSDFPTSCSTPLETPSGNLVVASTMSPTPRESRSAEALCNSCTDGTVGQPGSLGAGGSMWMSSEASSRCDLDSCDNLSVISPEDNTINLQEQNCLTGHPKHPASPARNPTQGYPLQIARPMPSSMERCLSCMSKLGQQGQDILSPSWTMDLNVPSNSGTAAAASLMPSSIPANNGHQHQHHHQGSMGSGNSDRLSISSHGSSGGVTEYYYDTPRSVLVAEARRNAAVRASTPPGHFQNGKMMHASSGGSNGSGGGCSSPYRNPRNTQSSNGFGGQQGSSCPAGCHCQNHPPARVMGGSLSSQGNSGIYYNGVAEQKAHGGKPLINHHSSGASTTSFAGPYENYDFPRCTHPMSFSPTTATGAHSSCACCPAGATVEHSTCSGIDWSKKPPMDRNSIASTSLGSDQGTSSEFYDTPPMHAPCACCNASATPPSCSGCGGSGQTRSHHPNGHAHSHYQIPACHTNDPMENYDIPPTHPGGIPLPAKDYTVTGGITRSVNGEGKMPLVSCRPNVASAHAIYAQVDKTKKTPRQLPHHHHFVNCDNTHQHHHHHHQPIYENHGSPQPCQAQMLQPQPTYANTEDPCTVPAQLPIKAKVHVPEPSTVNTQVNHLQSPPANLPPKQTTGGPYASNPASNYANLEYVDSLLLYENAQEIRQEPGPDLVATSSVEADPKASENKSVKEEPQPKTCSEEQPKSIPDEKERNISTVNTIPETKENYYENTQQPKVENEEVAKENISSDPDPVPPVRKESVEGFSNSKTEVVGATANNCENEEEPSLPLRRSSSVPCKGGHANRGSASSSDSGVSGDGGLFLDDSSPLNDLGSLCLHESLPRRGQRCSPIVSGKNASTPTPKLPDTEPVEEEEAVAMATPAAVDRTSIADSSRHYETIDESKGNSGIVTSASQGHIVSQSSLSYHQSEGNGQSRQNPAAMTAAKSSENLRQQRPHPKKPFTLVSDANSTSSGASDMSDYIESLSNCSRGSAEAATNIPVNSSGGSGFKNNISSSSTSPRKSTNMKPRSGKEYFKIDRSMFKNN